MNKLELCNCVIKRNTYLKGLIAFNPNKKVN